MLRDAATHRFVPDATSWSRVNAWWLADAAWIAYNHDVNVVRGVFRSRAQMDSCEVFASSGTECYLAQCASFAIVTFRGTQPDAWEDLFSDVLLKAVPWDVGHVHQGFGKALEPVWKPLEAALNNLSDRPVWFTGHSLGAALATLAAFRRGSRAAGVCTFGSPRVGNGVLAGHFDSQFVERITVMSTTTMWSRMCHHRLSRFLTAATRTSTIPALDQQGRPGGHQ